MKRKSIPPYPQIAEDVVIQATQIFTSEGNTLDTINLADGTLNPSAWTPNQELTVSFNFEVGDLAKLHKIATSVIPMGATSGIVLRWTSKGSMQSGWSKKVITLKEKFSKSQQLKLTFKANTLRDVTALETVIIITKSVAKPSINETHLSNTEGAIIGHLDEPSVAIRADGNGSMFPIFPTSELSPYDPLWSVECSWDDCSEDAFDKDNVRILVNTNHKDCPEEWTEGGSSSKLSALTKSIIRDAVGTMLIHVQNERDEQNWLSIINSHDLKSSNFLAGSVAHALWYLFHTYEMNDSSVAKLMQSAGKIKI